MPHALDTCLALAVLYEHISPAIQLYAFAVDFAHAYKHVPLLRSQGEFATVIIQPKEGEPLMSQLRTQPFCSRRSPANWGRVTAFARWVLERVFGLFLATYVDDCFSLEPWETAESADETANEVSRLLGLELDPAKSKLPAREIGLLGAFISFSPGAAAASLPDSKREALAADLKQLRSADKLSPAGA